MKRLALVLGIAAVLAGCGDESPKPAAPKAAAEPKAAPPAAVEAPKAEPAKADASKSEPPMAAAAKSAPAKDEPAAAKAAAKAEPMRSEPPMAKSAAKAEKQGEVSLPPIVRRGGKSADSPTPAPQAAALPEFPWPPPTPSAQLSLPNTLFPADKGAAQTLASVGERLVGALEQAKYFEYSHYRVPNGFALVARLERVGTDGTPQPEEFRFLQPGSREPFSMSLYVKQLFFAPEGFYRQIIFVVTDQPFRATGDKIDAQSAAELLSGGANRLSEDYAKAPFTAAHRVSALVYEFAKGAREGDVSTLTPGRLGARTHLDRAGIYPALALRK